MWLLILLIFSVCLVLPVLVLMQRKRRATEADTWHEPALPASRRPCPGQQRVGDDPRR
jgi:hypothetical protein